MVMLYNGNSSFSDVGFSDLEFSSENYVITLYAQFERHTYSMSFYNDDGETLLGTMDAPYGDFIGTPTILGVSKNEGNLDLYRTYRLKGWSQTLGGNVINLNTIRSSMDMSFYAVYEEVSVFSNILGNEFFTFTPTTGGYEISVKSNVQLKGKITLPVTYNNSNIVMIKSAGFADQSDLTYVFFDRDHPSYLKYIGASSFSNCTNLRYVEFPNSVTDIQNNAFQNCSSLLNEHVDPIIDDTMKQTMFRNIVDIGSRAFLNSGISGTLYISYTTENIQLLAFSQCNNLTDVQFGDEENGSRINTIGLSGNNGILQNSTIFRNYTPESGSHIMVYASYANITDLWESVLCVDYRYWTYDWRNKFQIDNNFNGELLRDSMFVIVAVG